ncbi:hypothetical protein QF035_006496 [Streptomyces umbrinus]|uniref:Secreted protein n=1 Tax=Streptomyces umbrinus TaxID=67370 RepID=A0ABU0T2A7_9ACTN|nr:hypothetical protein [Streptomyces umbrinus]MDQ1028914.1 hypothetical protein [Streptomyces umbrinus]
MPRPTAAQLAYGSCTVIFSTLAMLLLSQTSSGLGVVVIALSALVLGLLVAMTVPVPKPAAPAATVARPASVTLSERRFPVRRETVAAASAPEPVRERA